ncbi:MAG: dihydrofolate reductase family protein [Pseudomonadota bacterium]
MSKVILYIATSSDGFVADKNGGVDWLPQAADPGDTLGYKALLNRIQIIIMGRRSYEQILGFGDWSWSDKTTYVFTSKPMTTDRENIHFVHDDVPTFMKRFGAENPNQDIWLLGGAQLAHSFAQAKLIDECVITIVPTILGAGIKLELPYENFSLAQTKVCCDDLKQKIYRRSVDGQAQR